MKKRILNARPNWIIFTAGAFLPLLAATPVRAETPTIQVQEQSYNGATNEVTIRVSSNGMITLPGGNKLSRSATLVVNKNGVYSFQAEIDGTIVTDSIHVTKINSQKHRTNDPNIKLKLSYKDELSGIRQVRFRNEAEGTWSAWQNTAATTKSGTEIKNWQLSTASEGDRTVFVQFRDQAGNTTPGQAYDQIIYDVSGPTFSVSADQYYVNANTFRLNIKDLKDTYSPVSKVTIKVGNQAPVVHNVTTAFIKEMEGGLAVTVPAAERNNPGEKTIEVTAEDDLGNVSQKKIVRIYHDNQKPNKGDIELRTNDNQAVKIVEGGRQWNGQEGDYVYFDKKDNVRLVDDKHIRLQLNVGDAHAGVVPDPSRGGLARVDVIEYNIATDSKRNILESSRKEVKRQTYRVEIQPNGSIFVPWELSYGLEKQIAIVVYDNAGNSSIFYDSPIYMSSLNLIHFKVGDVVNPALEWKDVSYIFSDETVTPAQMVAGGNVRYNIAYSLLTAEEPERIYGSMEIKTVHEESGYEHSQIISLNEVDIKELDDKGVRAAFPYWADEFQVPETAPKGSKVYATGWLKADLVDGTDLRVYFPSKSLISDREIGTVTGNIHEDLQFRSVQPTAASND